MEDDPTTPVDNLNGDADTSTTATDPNGTGQGTGADANDSDPSKSTDTSSADGDKKPTANDSADQVDTPAPLDADLDDWIEKKGLAKPTTEAEKRAYQDMRNDQREFTRQQQAKKDSSTLADSVTKTKDELKPKEGDEELDPVEKRLADLEADRVAERTTRLQSEFYTTEKVTPEEHKQILEIFKEKVDRQPDNASKLKAVDLWGSPEALPDLLDIARARLAKTSDSSEVAEKAAREERERIARESNAKSPGRNASTTTTADKTETEAQVERFRTRFNK